MITKVAVHMAAIALMMGAMVSMSKASDVDISMTLFRALDAKLISEDTAMLLARKLISELYGKQELEAQEPLKISDGGDRWVVRGSREFEANPEFEDLPVPGKVEIIISKMDCQILRFTREAKLVPPR